MKELFLVAATFMYDGTKITSESFMEMPYGTTKKQCVRHNRKLYKEVGEILTLECRTAEKLG